MFISIFMFILGKLSWELRVIASYNTITTLPPSAHVTSLNPNNNATNTTSITSSSAAAAGGGVVPSLSAYSHNSHEVYVPEETLTAPVNNNNHQQQQHGNMNHPTHSHRSDNSHIQLPHSTTTNAPASILINNTSINNTVFDHHHSNNHNHNEEAMMMEDAMNYVTVAITADQLGVRDGHDNDDNDNAQGHMGMEEEDACWVFKVVWRGAIVKTPDFAFRLIAEKWQIQGSNQFAGTKYGSLSTLLCENIE